MKEVKFVCEDEHWESAMQNARHVQDTRNWFLSPLGSQQQGDSLVHWSNDFRNSCRQRQSALLRRTEKVSMSVLDLVVKQQG